MEKEHDETPNAVLRAELMDEHEEVNVEPTAEEQALEKEVELTVPEQRWLEDLELRAKEWKRDTSKQPFDAQAAIRGIHIDKFEPEDIALFHAYQQVQKNKGLYFTQKFGRMLRARIKDTQNDYNSTGYKLTKVLSVLSEAE